MDGVVFGGEVYLERALLTGKRKEKRESDVDS
jgi:hypothetical protein